MSLKNFREILRIVSQYVDASAAELTVNQDVIHLPLPYERVAVSAEDEAALRALGAHKDTEYLCWSYFCN
jgi:hypothetical protein